MIAQREQSEEAAMMIQAGRGFVFGCLNDHANLSSHMSRRAFAAAAMVLSTGIMQQMPQFLPTSNPYASGFVVSKLPRERAVVVGELHS